MFSQRTPLIDVNDGIEACYKLGIRAFRPADLVKYGSSLKTAVTYCKSTLRHFWAFVYLEYSRKPQTFKDKDLMELFGEWPVLQVTTTLVHTSVTS